MAITNDANGKGRLLQARIERLYADIFEYQVGTANAEFDFTDRPFPSGNLDALLEVIDELPTQEAVIVKAAYGLGREEKTVKEIADAKGTSEEKIDETLKEAIFRLREPNRQKKLRVITRTHDELVAQLFGFEQRRKLLEWAVRKTMSEEEDKA